MVWKKEYRQDSGGAGEFRGGLGQIMEVGTSNGAVGMQRLLRPHRSFRRTAAKAANDGQAGEVDLASGPRFRAKGLQTVPPTTAS